MAISGNLSTGEATGVHLTGRSFFFISFCSKLSISSIDTIIGSKNSSSISRLIFCSLSFNSLCFNSINLSLIPKGYFNILKSIFSCIVFCLQVFVPTLSGLVFENFVNFGQIRKIKSSQNIRSFGIRIQKIQFFNLSLIKKA